MPPLQQLFNFPQSQLTAFIGCASGAFTLSPLPPLAHRGYFLLGQSYCYVALPARKGVQVMEYGKAASAMLSIQPPAAPLAHSLATTSPPQVPLPPAAFAAAAAAVNAPPPGLVERQVEQQHR